jgi:hypothetical protein
MAQMTRRAALATVSLGALASTANSLVTVMADEPKARPKKLGALPPHWLDEVIGDGKNANEIAARFAKNKKFIDLVAHAIKEVQDNPPKPGLVGPTYPQRVRLKLLAELCPAAPGEQPVPAESDGKK